MLGLYSGAVVPAETLVELLWGEDPPRTAGKALQTHISGLRRALGDGFVHTQGAGWVVSTADVDAVRFATAARLGHEAMACEAAPQAVSCFDEALALWRGVPELPGGRRGDAERTRWSEVHAALIEDRADALLACGRAAELVGDLESAIANAPLRERRWGQLMLALYRSGRQGEALAAYRRVRQLLADELGVDPGPDLRRLQDRIVAQDPVLEIAVQQHFSTIMRAVTFLLTDIEGSTAAWEADAAAMGEALARHDALVEQVVTFGGGRLIKTRGEGDATFSVFDRPSAAATAAVALQEAVAQEDWGLTVPLRIRIALHTGEAEFRDGDYFGRAVNRAARLRSIAAGGQTLCSGATAELVVDSLSDDVILADVGTRLLKNLSRPEHVFELQRRQGDSAPVQGDEVQVPPPALPTVLLGAGPFVGRTAELDRLRVAWQTVLGSGARAVLIAGEPGVGKTRLAGEWSRRANDDGAVVVYGRCDEDLGAPYQPFTEALRTLAAWLGADRMRAVRGVESLIAFIPALADLLPDVPAAPRADPDTERYALFDAVVAALAAAASRAPVVLVLDDLHWAAKPTLLLLRHLLRFGDGMAVQIVGTYRSTDLDRTHPLAAMLADLHRDGRADRLSLGGLGEDDVSTYLSETGYDDDELARALTAVTAGNPFFLIEALRHVDESGGHWDPGTLPQGVREAVSRRLSRLASSTNQALTAAAVAGSDFSVDLVEQVADRDLVDDFDEAAKAGLLVEEAGGRYRFYHALVRQSLLAEIPSVRRMRLHQRIAAALERRSSSGDELLAELAFHYFECAWAGNATKAVEYCRRAADQAMRRLAYEGAADLYDKALHALDELDDELADREDLRTELLVALSEALLSAGDVASAAGAIAQLRSAGDESVRLRAWGMCFESQLLMQTAPHRLDEIESDVGEAATVLAGVGDASGEAKAHTVHAGVLARLGRVADCESALDRALVAARRAGEHRSVNAVLAGAPLAALWGPSPVPRAGGRCLDVVRLLRITTGSPLVEATSTRCQGVLDAMRGRNAAARTLIDSARRALNELGMRHAVLEVEQFAGIVELIAGDALAAERHLRTAYTGFRRMRLEADTAETAALLARACLALDRDADADELCSESEQLAGHALKAAIAWRTVRAQLLSRAGQHDLARRYAEEAVAMAERTDALVDHGDACLALATVADAAGDRAGAAAAAERAVQLYQTKGAAALVQRARGLLGSPVPDPVVEQGRAADGPDNACVRAGRAVVDAVDRRDWPQLSEHFAATVEFESRRKIVGVAPASLSFDQWLQAMLASLSAGLTRYHQVCLAVRGDRLALIRLCTLTDDDSSGSPMDEFLMLGALDDDGRICAQVSFDAEDLDEAIIELDRRYLAGEAARCARTYAVIVEAFAAVRRREIPPTAPDFVDVDHRSGTGIVAGDLMAYLRTAFADSATNDFYAESVHRLTALGAVVTHVATGTTPAGLGVEWRVVDVMTVDGDLLDRVEMFDESQLDAALRRFAELSASPGHLENEASRRYELFNRCYLDGDDDGLSAILADDFLADDRRRVVGGGKQEHRESVIEHAHVTAELRVTNVISCVIATRGERLVLMRSRYWADDERPDAFDVELLHLIEIDTAQRIVAFVAFDADALGAAVEELDVRYVGHILPAHIPVYSVVVQAFAALNRGEIPPTTENFVDIDHRAVSTMAPGDLKSYLRLAFADTTAGSLYVEAVHRLSPSGAVVTHVATGTTHDGLDVEWRFVNVLTMDGDRLARCEMYDDADLDAALARLDELCSPGPGDNTAGRTFKRWLAAFDARDWDAMAHLHRDDAVNDDRRRVANAGVILGRDSVLDSVRALATVGVTHIEPHVIATRGDRLVMIRQRVSGGVRTDAFSLDVVVVIEVDADGLFATGVAFDPADMDAAITELDARYLAGEGASCAPVWSLVVQAYATFNRHELSKTTSDWVNIDHRLGVGSAPGDMNSYVSASWTLVPDINTRIEAVHRLTPLGAVFTHTERGTSHEGFDAEWREVALLTFDGDAINRCELYDERDLGAALAHFDELTRAGFLAETSATRMNARLVEAFNNRDAAGYLAFQAVDARFHDRRRGLLWEGPNDAAFAQSLMSQAPDSWLLETATIAVRSDHRALVRYAFRDTAEAGRPVTVEALALVDVNDDQLVTRSVLYDVENFEEARGELDRD